MKSKTELTPTQERVNGYLSFMLGRQDYTESKLKQKAYARFPDSHDMCDIGLCKMKELDYINDKRFITRYVESCVGTNSMGPAKLKQELFKKGFPSSLIENVMSSDTVVEANFFENALHMKVKYYGKDPITEPKERQRAMGKLVRKGFSFEDASKCLSVHADELFESF